MCPRKDRALQSQSLAFCHRAASDKWRTTGFRNSRDVIDGDIARYWSHLIEFISMESCAFAAIGRIEIANAVLINRSLISLLLLKCQQGLRALEHGPVFPYPNLPTTVV
jgi:hypothetical protein